MVIANDMIPTTVISSDMAIFTPSAVDPQIDCSVNFTSEQVAEFWAGYTHYNPQPDEMARIKACVLDTDEFNAKMCSALNLYA